MSGGDLVVLNRNGRAVKKYSLPGGLATIGSDLTSDICVMLATVSPHHATVSVHANQTILRKVGDGDTLVNGAKISVAALEHGDIISVGGRSLRWEYSDTSHRRHKLELEPVFFSRAAASLPMSGDRKRRSGRCMSAGAGAVGVDRAVQLAIEMSHRASMPASSGGKQVAIVQPQPRDISNTQSQSERSVQSQAHSSKRSRSSNLEVGVEARHVDEERRKRRSVVRAKARATSLQSTTKATLWIESRKTSPRRCTKPSQVRASLPPRLSLSASARRDRATRNKNTPLRMTVLRKAQSTQKARVTKIEEPVTIDETKQAAILLMTGHAVKSKLVAGQLRTPSIVVKKLTPLMKSQRLTGSRVRRHEGLGVSSESTPRRPSSYSLGGGGGGRKRIVQNRSMVTLATSDTDRQHARRSNALHRSPQRSPSKSLLQLNPKKSALKDPKRLSKKTESIKFDLSNLENGPQESSAGNSGADRSTRSVQSDCSFEDEYSLKYSDSSLPSSPRQPIHSRSSKILEKSIGVPMSLSPRYAVDHDTCRTRRSMRGSLIVKKALELPDDDTLQKSTYSTNVESTSIASAFKTHTLSPRRKTNMESYSIVDLVSVDSNESIATSVYNSVATDGNTSFGTPESSAGRRTRSTIDLAAVSSSTPYSGAAPEPPGRGQHTTQHGNHSDEARQSTTPENVQKHVSVNSTRVSRPSKSRSRLNDSELMLIEDEDSDASPKSSKRISRTFKSMQYDSTVLKESFDYTNMADATNCGTTTPENKPSSQDINTPVLNIQSMLETNKQSHNLKTRYTRPNKRKTIGILRKPKKSCLGVRSRSLNTSTRKVKLNLTKDCSASEISAEDASELDKEQVVTPKSTVKLIPEAVKQKHSTAKKPQSKRSIIDHLNESDIVKQLFNSPVKRKLSRSMTDFSQKQLFEDDELKEPTNKPVGSRNTIGRIPHSPDDSVAERSEVISPERFVSPMSTPRHSPNMSGIKRLFAELTPGDNVSDASASSTGRVSRAGRSLRTPRPTSSIKDELKTVPGVQLVFAISPGNRFRAVTVQNVNLKSPRSHSPRVTGLKSLFQHQKEPKNDLSDIRGVRELFRKSHKSDLRNVSGVKRVLRRGSPRNDLSDLSGVGNLFSQEELTASSDYSGADELLPELQRNTSTAFDRLIGKARVQSVYSKTFPTRNTSGRRVCAPNALHSSIGKITNNVEEWLENELQRRACLKQPASTSVLRELRKLTTDTVGGGTPLRECRVRDSTLVKCSEGEQRRSTAAQAYSASKLPIKKRSLADRSAGSTRYDGTLLLPIKKRRVMHSTPVKNNLTINPSELSQVSPIHAPGRVSRQPRPRLQYSATQPPAPPAPPAPRSEALLEPAKTYQEKAGTVKESKCDVEPSPRKTRARTNVLGKGVSAVSARTRVSSKRTLLINKKKPGLSPAAVKNNKTAIEKTKINANDEKLPSPSGRPKKQKRNQLATVKLTPMKNNVKKQNDVDHERPSAQLPRLTDNDLVSKPVVPLHVRNVRGRRARITVLSPSEAPALRNTRRAVAVIQSKNKNSEVLEQARPARGGRKARAELALLDQHAEPHRESPRRTRRTKKLANIEDLQVNKKLIVVEPTHAVRTRRRAQVTVEASDVAGKPVRGKRQAPALRQDSFQSTSSASSLRMAETNKAVKANETKSKKRKAGAALVGSEPVSAARGNRKPKVISKIEASASTQRRVIVQETQPDPGSRTGRRGKALLQVAPASNKDRVHDKETTSAADASVGRRTRRGNLQTAAATETRQQPVGKRGNTTSSAAADPPTRVTRRTAAKNPPPEVGVADRMRTRKR